MERGIRKVYLDLHHVYHWRRLVSLKEVDLIEVIDTAVLCMVSEKMVHDIMTDRTRTHQPERIGLRHALHRGEEWLELNGTSFRSCRDHQIGIWPP